MHAAWRRLARPKPEEQTSIRTEALEVGMSGRTVLAVVIDALRDPERTEHACVKFDRAIEIADREKDVIQHVVLGW
jgi:hypothetical protein